MELQDIKKIIEAYLFIAEQPVTPKMLEGIFEKEISKDQIAPLIEELTFDYAQRHSALEVRQVGAGWQLATRPEFGPWIRRLFKDRLTYRLSQSALETLTIIAYKQPITRGEIEQIRGVEVSAVMDTLLERKLARIAGRKEAIGRPLLYGTTLDFLRAFGLKRLEDLPALDALEPPSTEAVAAAEGAALPVEPADAPAGESISAEAEAAPASTEA